MKKFTGNGSLGGAPVFSDDLAETFNSEIWGVIQGLLSPYDSDTEGLIISGCDVSSGSDYDITAGIVYLNGEFMRLPASTGNAFTSYIAPATAASITRTFADGSTAEVLENKVAEIVGSAPGAGQYITISDLTIADLRRWRPIVHTSAINIRTKVIEIGDWDMDATATINVPHGVADYKKILSYEAIIRNDSDGTYSKLDSDDAGGTKGYYQNITSTNFQLGRTTGGGFDSTSFDSTSYNRGFIYITYYD